MCVCVLSLCWLFLLSLNGIFEFWLMALLILETWTVVISGMLS